MPRTCLQPLCPEPALDGQPVCAGHSRVHNKAFEARFKRFYNSAAWQRQRERYLAEHPMCEHVEQGKPCGRIAECVHHIQELADGGAPRNPDNLEALCLHHHQLEHAQRRRAA